MTHSFPTRRSSDLPVDLQEIGEHRMTMLGRDAFGVELDAVDRQIGVAETHHRAVVARRVDDEVLGNVDDLEAVVARRLKGVGQAGEEPAAVVTDGRGLAVHPMAADRKTTRLTSS